MNRFSGSMITQQMYTRARRGVYRATEGFDTVAKSESLDNNFVKKILHPFCLYDAPAELAARGEKEEALYPAALHLFHTESNETVIGQSRYVAADFTGQRSAFFAHNFVVPPIRSEEIVEKYGDWLHAGFAHQYEGEPGGTLPELESIPAEAREASAEPMTVLRRLGFTEELFKALVQAVMLSVAGKKKLYVALDVPVSELSQRAVELTEVIYASLPYDFRRRLGVITYAKEPQSRKYIHLTFVEKGSLRPGDRNIEKDYLFDMANKRVLNADFGGSQQQMYADLVWKTLDQPGGSLRDFAKFADALLLGESTERKLSLAVYNELAVFYEIEQGNEELYTENKNAVLAGLLSYLKPEGKLDSRVRLNDMFLERFDREYDLIRKRGIPSPEILEQFKAYFILPGHHYRVKIIDYFINGMLNCQSGGREDVLAAAYGILESEPALSEAFFKRVLPQTLFRRALFDPYLESRLAAATGTADLLRMVAHFGLSLPEVLEQGTVRDTLKDYLLEKLRQEPDPVTAVAAIHDAVQEAEKQRRRGGVHPDALSLMQELGTTADRFLLNRLSLDELSMEQLLEISFLRYRDASDWQPPLDAIAKRKANALRAAYRWFGEENPDEEIFAGLSPRELDDVQLLGARWLRESRSLEPFDRLPLAFYHSSEREGGPLDYDSLLDLVVRKAGNDKETVYRFLDWSQHSWLFASSGKKLWPNYKRAVLRYFLKSDREAFKNRGFRKNYMEAATPAMQNVYNEARAQLASPLARWVSRSRFQILISGGVLVILLITGMILISQLGGRGGDTAAPAASPSPLPGVAGEAAPVSVRLISGAGIGSADGAGADGGAAGADNGDAGDGNGTGEGKDNGGAGDNGSAGQDGSDAGDGNGGNTGEGKDGSGTEEPKGNAKLLYSFAAAADCSAFKPAEIAVVSGDGVTDTYKVQAMVSRCLVEPGAGGADGADSEAGAGKDDGAGGKASAGADGSVNGEAAASPAAAGAAGATPPARPYEVTVELAPGAKLAAGDMITAGGYSLKLEADPGTAPEATATAAPSAEPSAPASPEADGE